MAKENKNFLIIFFESLKIYCVNIHKFLLYMAFPVLGQLLGLFMVFGLTFWFSQNYQDLIIKYPALNDMSTTMICTVIMVIPGLLIFMKAFWDYLIAYSALNSMTQGYINTGRIYDFKAHNDVALQKTISFVALWFLFGIYTLLAIIPIFWVLGLIFFIYFVLIFQVFTFETGHSPVGYFKRSFEIIKTNFAKTFFLMLLLGLVSYILLPAGLSVIFDYLNITSFLSKVFENWVFTLPLEALEPFGITPSLLGAQIEKQLVLFLMIGFTLPLRSVCWTLWYKNLADNSNTKNKETKPRKKSIKKKTDKSIPKTFKIEKREIDPEIIRRARLEDDEY